MDCTNLYCVDRRDLLQNCYSHLMRLMERLVWPLRTGVFHWPINRQQKVELDLSNLWWAYFRPSKLYLGTRSWMCKAITKKIWRIQMKAYEQTVQFRCRLHSRLWLSQRWAPSRSCVGGETAFPLPVYDLLNLRVQLLHPRQDSETTWFMMQALGDFDFVSILMQHALCSAHALVFHTLASKADRALPHILLLFFRLKLLLQIILLIYKRREYRSSSITRFNGISGKERIFKAHSCLSHGWHWDWSTNLSITKTRT